MVHISSINNNFESFQQLIRVYEKNKHKFFENIEVEFSGFFAANLSAVLGAILDDFLERINNVELGKIPLDTEKILLKNDFLSYFGRERKFDNNHTTIKYQKLKPSDGKYFKNYVIDELIDGHSSDLPKMSRGVKDRIIEAIYEIFANAQIHSGSEYIYTCGQFYPRRNSINFTIVDVGVGFKHKINNRFNKNLSSEEAIAWAVEDSHTTKTNVSGGLGLAILKEFVVMNNGKMQIISGDGFYQVTQNEIKSKTFEGEFPGTIVNLQFCTNDNNNYALKAEVDINNIF